MVQLRENAMATFQSLKNQLLAADIPCYILWKNKKLVYQGANEHILKTLHFNSINDAIGRTDYEFPWAYEAKKLRAVDQQVLEGKVILNSKEYRWHVDGPRTVIVNKLPLKDAKERTIGVLAILQDFTAKPKSYPEDNLIRSTLLYLTIETELIFKFKTLLNIILTRREVKCLSLWLAGFSINESSCCLNISTKSIEAYRKQIKDKMDICHKFQLIDLVASNDTFHLFLFLAKLTINSSKYADLMQLKRNYVDKSCIFSQTISKYSIPFLG